jgi:F-type H+-transporting ATPase subunit b
MLPNLFIQVVQAATETAGTHAEVENNLLAVLGIDWKIFIAQIVNFVIVLLVLWRFAYRPLVKILNERSKKIDQSLKDAAEIEKRLADVKNEQANLLASAQNQAQELIRQAEIEATAVKQKLLFETDQTVAAKLSDLTVSLEAEKNKMLKEVNNQIVGLVVKVVKQILPSVVSQEIDQTNIQSILKKEK